MMKTQNAKDKRAGIRIPLLAEKIQYFLDGKEFQAQVGDITNEGLFLKTSDLLKPKSDVTLRISLPGDLGHLDVPAKVVRVNWAVRKQAKAKKNSSIGMGVSFGSIDENRKKILDAYVVYLRNKQIITVSKRIIEEFFGAKGPKKFL